MTYPPNQNVQIKFFRIIKYNKFQKDYSTEEMKPFVVTIDIRSTEGLSKSSLIRLFLILNIKFVYGRSLFTILQLNLHETDLLFCYLSHHLTWHLSSISEDLHRFARRLQHLSAKLFLLLFLNNFRHATCKIV